VQQPHHPGFVDQPDHARRDRRRVPDADGLPGETSFAEEVARTEHRDNRFPPASTTPTASTPPLEYMT
jgi:hypothetical protein